jgi:hypothetical protein
MPLRNSGQLHHNSIVLDSTSAWAWVHKNWMRIGTGIVQEFLKWTRIPALVPTDKRVSSLTSVQGEHRTTLENKKNSRIHCRTEFRKQSANMKCRSRASRDSGVLLEEEALCYVLAPKYPQRS